MFGGTGWGLRPLCAAAVLMLMMPGVALAAAWTGLHGERVDLDDSRGRVVVLNFWATWCRPCVEEMPDLMRVRQRYAAYGVEFLGASADAPDQRDVVIEFVERLGIDFRVVLGATTEQMEALGLPPALPATVVLDERGDVVERFPGVVDPGRLEAALSDLLGVEALDLPARHPDAEGDGIDDHGGEPDHGAHAHDHGDHDHGGDHGDDHDADREAPARRSEIASALPLGGPHVLPTRRASLVPS